MEAHPVATLVASRDSEFSQVMVAVGMSPLAATGPSRDTEVSSKDTAAVLVRDMVGSPGMEASLDTGASREATEVHQVDTVDVPPRQEDTEAILADMVARPEGLAVLDREHPTRLDSPELSASKLRAKGGSTGTEPLVLAFFRVPVFFFLLLCDVN